MGDVTNRTYDVTNRTYDVTNRTYDSIKSGNSGLQKSAIGALVGFLIFIGSLASAGNTVFRKDSEGIYRFRLFGTIQQGLKNPFFKTAPDFVRGVKFFFRLDNPWFVVPTGAAITYFFF